MSSDTANPLTAQLRACEQALLDPAVRRDRDRVSTLLAEDFVEFGTSGKVWTREGILDLLATEEYQPPVIESFDCREIAEGICTGELSLGAHKCRRRTVSHLAQFNLVKRIRRMANALPSRDALSLKRSPKVLNFVVLEQVILLAARALGAFQAAHKQHRDSHRDQDGQKIRIRREPMDHAMHNFALRSYSDALTLYIGWTFFQRRGVVPPLSESHTWMGHSVAPREQYRHGFFLQKREYKAKIGVNGLKPHSDSC